MQSTLQRKKPSVQSRKGRRQLKCEDHYFRTQIAPTENIERITGTLFVVRNRC